MSAAAPWRDPRYAASALDLQATPAGLTITATTPLGRVFETLNGPLAHWAAVDPHRAWLAERSGAGWRMLSYGEAAARTAALAAGLAGLGLGPGRPLMIVARNGIDPAVVTYAAARLGCPVAPITPQYAQPGAAPERLTHALTLIGPAAVFVDDPAREPLLRTAGLGAGVRVLSPADLPGLERGAAAPDLARGAMVAKLLLTSGSTGAPKAVVNTHANLALNAAQIAACFDDPDPPITVNCAPWSHSLGANAILHMIAHRGGTLYVDPGQPTPGRFGETLSALGEVAATYHNMVPAGWALLADALERDDALARTFFGRLRVMQYGGAGLPQAVLDRVQAAGLRTTGERITFAAGYGVTETAPTALNVHWPNGVAGLLGLPVPGTSARLAPVGDRMELRLKGPQISPGYRSADGSLRPLDLDEEGWLRTGDAVRLADPGGDPRRGGLVFDGRLVENFKLATGAFVGAGALRLAALSALGGLASDAVVCGEGQSGVGLLLFANAAACADLAGAGAAPHACCVVAAEIGVRLAAFNADRRGAGGRIARALVLAGAPDPASGEVTEKGYLNQALARSRRAAEIARLFAPAPDPLLVVL